MADTPRDAALKQPPAPRNEKASVDFGYVGIDSILEQMRRKAMKQGFEFNIMVVERLGKVHLDQHPLQIQDQPEVSAAHLGGAHPEDD
uniref:Septin 9 n=1 Tax=Ovis aries TaxID=9940 RepID=A0AC11ESA8_SHEEP